MQRAKVFTGLLTVGILALSAGVALASEGAAKASGGARPAAETAKATKGSEATFARTAPRVEVRRVRGQVAAVEPGATPPTVVVKVMEGKTPLIVGVDVTGKTLIWEGKARKTVSDIKVGDRVWLKYERTPSHLMAQDIRLLKPYRVAAES